LVMSFTSTGNTFVVHRKCLEFCLIGLEPLGSQNVCLVLILHVLLLSLLSLAESTVPGDQYFGNRQQSFKLIFLCEKIQILQNFSIIISKPRPALFYQYSGKSGKILAHKVVYSAGAAWPHTAATAVFWTRVKVSPANSPCTSE